MTDLEAAKLEGVRLGLDIAASLFEESARNEEDQAFKSLLVGFGLVLRAIDPARIVAEATPEGEK